MGPILAQASDEASGLGVLVVVGALYFVPLIVAMARHVPNIGSVAVINIFLGWTVIGWVVALAMAVRTVPPTQPASVSSRSPRPSPSRPPRRPDR